MLNFVEFDTADRVRRRKFVFAVEFSPLKKKYFAVEFFVIENFFRRRNFRRWKFYFSPSNFRFEKIGFSRRNFDRSKFSPVSNSPKFPIPKKVFFGYLTPPVNFLKYFAKIQFSRKFSFYPRSNDRNFPKMWKNDPFLFDRG